jgi:hypothetical protein
VLEHQWRTVDNLITLCPMAPEVPIIPVLQGFEVDDYLRISTSTVRRGGPDRGAAGRGGLGLPPAGHRRDRGGLPAIRDAGVDRLHGFGVKALGLRRYGQLLTSADSMAWSMQARREAPAAGLCGPHQLRQLPPLRLPGPGR